MEHYQIVKTACCTADDWLISFGRFFRVILRPSRDGFIMMEFGWGIDDDDHDVSFRFVLRVCHKMEHNIRACMVQLVVIIIII